MVSSMYQKWIFPYLVRRLSAYLNDYAAPDYLRGARGNRRYAQRGLWMTYTRNVLGLRVR